MKTVTVRDLVVGEGAPKIIVSLMGKTITDVKSEALAYREADFDILEWRVDHFANVTTAEAYLRPPAPSGRLLPINPCYLPSAARKKAANRR